MVFHCYDMTNFHKNFTIYEEYIQYLSVKLAKSVVADVFLRHEGLVLLIISILIIQN